jgi:cell division protein FtsB
MKNDEFTPEVFVQALQRNLELRLEIAQLRARTDEVRAKTVEVRARIAELLGGEDA